MITEKWSVFGMRVPRVGIAVDPVDTHCAGVSACGEDIDGIQKESSLSAAFVSVSLAVGGEREGIQRRDSFGVQKAKRKGASPTGIPKENPSRDWTHFRHG